MEAFRVQRSNSARAPRASGRVASRALPLGSYRPMLRGYTRVLALRGRVVMVAKIHGAVWAPTTERTLKHCVGFLTPILYCGWTDRFATPDHRCDRTPVSAPVIPAPPPQDRYPLAPAFSVNG